MSRYIEYYEVKTQNGYEYYFMPVDADAKNKQNFDGQSHRIWKFDTKTNRTQTIKNIREHKPEANRAEFMKIQLMASPVPYSEYYLRLQDALVIYHEQRQAEESSTVDQVPDT